jgi:hypothetical protein
MVNGDVQMSAASAVSVNPDLLMSSTTCGTMNGQQQQLNGDSTTTGTYEWLLNAGVPFSAFDPVALTEPSSKCQLHQQHLRQYQGPRGTPAVGSDLQDDLLECADEITALFSAPASSSSSTGPSCSAATIFAPTTVASSSTGSEPSVGININIKDIQPPSNDFLGDIDDSLWALY